MPHNIDIVLKFRDDGNLRPAGAWDGKNNFSRILWKVDGFASSGKTMVI